MKVLAIAILFLIQSSSLGLNSIPIPIFIDTALSNASFIAEVKVWDYNDSQIIFLFEGTDTLKAEVAPFKQRLNHSLDSLVKSRLFGSCLSGYWPNPQEEVLIVLDPKNEVSLFAYSQGDKYRFWCPYYTGSSALFYFKSPATHLKNGSGTIFRHYKTIEDSVIIYHSDRNKQGYLSCWDGCLYPKKDLQTSQ